MQTPIYETYPCLNTKLSDCVKSNNELFNKELVLDWDVLRDELDVARRLLALERCATAVSKLNKES